MKTLTIALSLILSLGIFGCHDKDYSPTSFNVTGSTPEPVRPELPSHDPSRSCRGVSSWDGVTEGFGDVFCSPPTEPVNPTSREPIFGCTGTVTTQAQLDSVRDCTVLYGSIYLRYDSVTVINLPLLEQITGEVFLSRTSRLTKILLPALTSVDTTIEIDHNEVLTELSLPVLNTVGDRLYITDDDALTEISLPLLTIVGGKIRISYNDELTDVSIPTLTSVDNDENDSAYISFNNSLQICDLGSYTDQYCP